MPISSFIDKVFAVSVVVLRHVPVVFLFCSRSSWARLSSCGCGATIGFFWFIPAFIAAVDVAALVADNGGICMAALAGYVAFRVVFPSVVGKHVLPGFMEVAALVVDYGGMFMAGFCW